MATWKNFSLRTKINVIPLAVLIVFLGIGLTWEYRQQRSLFFSEAVDKAKIITAEATRTREYVSNQLKIDVAIYSLGHGKAIRVLQRRPE